MLLRKSGFPANSLTIFGFFYIIRASDLKLTEMIPNRRVPLLVDVLLSNGRCGPVVWRQQTI